MNHWPKIASVVVLDSQALFTIRIHIVKKTLFIMMSGERLGPWAFCFFHRKLWMQP